MNRRVAVTFTHNHSTYTDLWTSYYSRFFDSLRFIDIDGPIRNDWGATTRNLNEEQEGLFKGYNLILFADVDEFVVPDPEKYKDLGEYLDKVEEDVVRCVGYNVIQMDEPELDLTQPIMKQRSYWSHDPMYNKYVILTKPQVFLNNHNIQNSKEQDSDLFMLHLRDADIKSAVERCEALGRTFDMNEFEKRKATAQPIPNKWKEVL